MIASPYTPGTTPTVLVGRGEQLDGARADLAVMATYGRFQGRVRVDIGSRGVGKTSLLKAGARRRPRGRCGRGLGDGAGATRASW